MKRPQIGTKYKCIEYDYRKFTKNNIYIVVGFDIDDDILLENDSGQEIFFTWKDNHKRTSMYLSNFFTPMKIYLGGE